MEDGERITVLHEKVREKDRQIVEFVRNNPTASILEISTALDIHASTVQKRVQSLINEGKLTRVIQVIEEDGETGFLFDIDINPNALLELSNGKIKSYAAYARYIRTQIADTFRIEKIWTKLDGGITFVIRTTPQNVHLLKTRINELSLGRNSTTIKMVTFLND